MNVPEFICDPSENVYEQVADHIEARIAAGDLRSGSMLPNDRELAVEYGVAVGTARKAAGLLQKRGLIKIRRSKGKFVAESRESIERHIEYMHEALDDDA